MQQQQYVLMLRYVKYSVSFYAKKRQAYQKYVVAKSSNAATQVGKPVSLIGIAVFSSICIGAFGLGCWQVKRYNWKVELMKQTRDDAMVVPETIADEIDVHHIQNLKGRVVVLKGTFDHSKEVLLGLRSAPAGLFEAAQGLATNPQGYYVITPMIRPDKSVVFVNRGWVPRTAASWSRPEGVVSQTSVVSDFEKKALFSPVNAPSSGRLVWLEREAVLEAGALPADVNTCLLEAVVDGSVSGEAAAGVNRKGQLSSVPVYPACKTPDSLHEQHVQPVVHAAYAFTWFSLSAAGLLMTFFKFRRSKRIGRMIQKKTAAAKQNE